MFKRFWVLMNEADAGEGGGVSAGSAADSVDDSALDSDEADVNWGDVADEFVAEDTAVEGDLEVVEPAEETPPAAAPAAEPASGEPKPAAQEPTAPTPVQPVTPPPMPTASPEEYQTWRTNRLTQLEQNYALDPESATALLTEPETVLPKLAAKVHMEVLENSMRAMQAMVPVMMQQVSHYNEVNSRAKNLFTSVNPDLADPRLESTILELGTVYRNVNKTAPPEQAARDIGNLVRAALGLTAPAPQGQMPGVQAPVQTPTRQAPAAPFVPARGSGGGYQPSRPSNPYEQMALEMLNEDF